MPQPHMIEQVTYVQINSPRPLIAELAQTHELRRIARQRAVKIARAQRKSLIKQPGLRNGRIVHPRQQFQKQQRGFISEDSLWRSWFDDVYC
jgi:hypothetical protein